MNSTFSWTFITLAILVSALLTSGYILWRRYHSRRLLMQRVAELETLSTAGQAIVAAKLDVKTLCELIAHESGKVIDNSTFQVGLFDGDLYHILFWGATKEQLLDEISKTYNGKVVVGSDLDIY